MIRFRVIKIDDDDEGTILAGKRNTSVVLKEDLAFFNKDLSCIGYNYFQVIR